MPSPLRHGKLEMLKISLSKAQRNVLDKIIRKYTVESIDDFQESKQNYLRLRKEQE